MATVRLDFLSWIANTVAKDGTGSEASLEIEASGSRTVRDVLNRLASEYPQFAKLVFDPKSQRLSWKVAVFYNGAHLEMADGLDTAIKGGDVLTFLPPIEGG